VAGKRVAAIAPARWLEAGSHRFDLELQLPAGMYYLRAKSGQQVIAKAIAITR
jgi:hypothetical protein